MKFTKSIHLFISLVTITFAMTFTTAEASSITYTADSSDLANDFWYSSFTITSDISTTGYLSTADITAFSFTSTESGQSYSWGVNLNNGSVSLFGQPRFYADSAGLYIGYGDTTPGRSTYTDDTGQIFNFYQIGSVPTDSIGDSFPVVALYNYLLVDGVYYVRIASAPTTPTPSQVPLPADAWLFCSGLLGLIGVSRRKKKVRTQY